MSFNERSFGGRLFRPRPEIYFSAEERLLVAATPWGPRASAQRAIEIITSYYLASRDDSETTSPFDRLSCLSAVANNLRISVLLANEWLSREQNRNEYTAGVEVCLLARREQELVYLQVGHPQLLLHRTGRGLIPLGCALDLSLDLSPQGQILPPLPQQLLGLDKSVNLSVNSLRPASSDKLILISRSLLPSSLFTLTDVTLESVTRLLADDNADLPFWLGLLDQL